MKPKRKNKSDLGENYIAPDGGWGWVVCVASGISNVGFFFALYFFFKTFYFNIKISFREQKFFTQNFRYCRDVILISFLFQMVVLPGLQLFGLIYRKNLAELGISSTETSTLFNMQYAVSSFTGLFNGPLFRRFTFREIGLIGAALVFIGLFASAWSTNFLFYILTFSIVYGIGMGLAQSSGSLALNTYFKTKRRKATGFAWTITGIGPIVLPHLAVFVLASFGYKGTVLTFALLSLLAFAAAITYRPALQFNKAIPIENVENGEEKTESDDLLGKIKQPEKSSLMKFIEDLDLALLKDKSFLNILIGLTIIALGELNFFVLVPFILEEAGFTDKQISLTMSVLAGVDISVRFLGPFATQKLRLGNKSLFAIGILAIAIGRFITVMTQDFHVIIFAFTLLGFGKALRTIIRPLIVADYVPLKQLPAASGLLLVATALFSFSAGPLFGLCKEYLGYAVTVHIINGFSFICLLSWGIETLIIKISGKIDIVNEGP